MSINRNLALIDELRMLPAETSWFEFKCNNKEPGMIGRTVSALSNAARLADQHFAYIVWGIEDGSHRVVGTSFQPSKEVSQGHPPEFWLAQRPKPSISLKFQNVRHGDADLILLEIPAATTGPIEFDGSAYVRIGSATPHLSDHPSRLHALWDKLRPYIWETGIADPFVTQDEITSKLDYPAYFELTAQPLPTNLDGIIERLSGDRLISKDVGGRWNITNLGAILFAKRLDAFEPRLARKGVRFVAYSGKNRADSVGQRQDGQRGYASGFARLIDFIGASLPRNEHIDKAFRVEAPVFPDIMLRESIANALIHQDMTITGAGPLIELFSDRLEVTNPGTPLIQPERFIDFAPRSRNESLASLMRRMHICEEQGTGIDKIVAAVELFQLPPPDFRVEENATRVVLYAPRRFAEMTVDERVRACYQHAVLKYVSGERMRNSTLRERFGIEAKNAAQVSQVIRLAIQNQLIRVADPERPQSAYVPIWA